MGVDNKFEKSIPDPTHTGGGVTVVVNNGGRRFIQTAQPSGAGWWIGLTDDEAVRLVKVLAETMDADTRMAAIRAMAEVMREQN